MEKTSQTINVEQDLRRLVGEVLEAAPDAIDPNASFVKDMGMDSMMALEILAGIEKKYRISIPEETLPKFTSLNQTIKIVKALLEKN